MKVDRDLVELLDIPVDVLDGEAVVAKVVEAARKGGFFQVATVNLDFLVNSSRDDELREILRTSAINVADGAPVVWATRFLGHKAAERVAGADLVPALMPVAARQGLRVFFLGGEHGAAEVAAQVVREANPGLEIAAFEPARSALEDMDDARILAEIEVFAPHVLLVAFGHPKQDKWIYRHRSQLPMVAIGVGCSFDLIAGRHSRAPQWVQNIGMEWGYRLAHEPRRLVRRYATDGLWAAGTLLPWVISQRTGWADRVGN